MPIDAPFLGDESAESYYQPELGVANYSGLKIIASQTLAHYRHKVLNPTPDAEASAGLAFGKALHCALLEPDTFHDRYAIVPADAPDRPTKAMREAKKPSESSIERVRWWDAWEAENVGRLVLPRSDYDRALYMGEAGRADPTVGALLDGGKREVTLRWTDEDTGLPCKARADIWHPEIAICADPKTTASAHPRAWERAILNFDYHLQHVHYSEAFKACGQPLKHFLFVLMERDPPYVVQTRQIDAQFEELGYRRWRRAMRLLAGAVQTNRWPAYGGGIQVTTPPAYAFYSEPEESDA